MKVCNKCKIDKSFEMYYTNTDGSLKHPWCKTCLLAKNKEYREANKEKCRAISRKNSARYRQDPEFVKKERERINQWRLDNLDKHAAKEARRRSLKLKATPDWADHNYINDLYSNCKEAEELFASVGVDIKFHVDHIVPLKHSKVCGLHVEHNLQILTAEENMKKSNKFEVK